jgi:ASC-1-like (ASCH) protein
MATGLLSGRKRVESRFARRRRLPYGRVSPGDEVYFKVSGGYIIGRSRVARVRQFDALTPRAIDTLRRRYNQAIKAPDAYWDARRDCRYGVLIWLRGFSRRVRRIPVPRQYGSGWVVLAGRVD